MSDLRGLHLHFDAPSGAAGDMTLGALFDLGVPEAAVREALAGLGVGGYELRVARARRGGLMGTDVKVIVEGDRHHHRDHEPEHGQHHAHPHEGHDHHSHAHAEYAPHEHRHYREIRALVDRGTRGRVRELSLAIFDRVAVAEAKLHGVEIDEVAFHEVGAIDSIVDTVGAAAAVAWLAPASVSGSPVAVGGGTVRVAHGKLPIPAPATLEICRAAGVPTVPGGVDRELLTPTGAAILATLVESWGPLPPMTAVAVGYGAGDMELADRPNLLRATVGRRLAEAAAGEIVELAANLDDMSPELCEHVGERLFAAGALDVWWTPTLMKKSRPAFQLGVLVDEPRRAAVTRVILEETTTLGVRAHRATRTVLERRSVSVETAYGAIPVKLGLDGGRVLNAAPEHDACRAAARAHGVPLKEVYAAAVAAFRRT
jgi:uncharacterized protein (TIGR00299 family) protein